MNSCSTCRFTESIYGKIRCKRFVDRKKDVKDDPIYLDGCEYCHLHIVIMKPEEFGCLLHEPKDSENV